MFLLRCVTTLLMLLAGLPASAAEVLTGPYEATVERVVDGDTLAVRVTVWLQQDVRVLVRVRGIDAPELRGNCEGEKSQANAAKQTLARLVAGGQVVLTQIEGDKYYGRVLADVVTPEGEDVGSALLAGGLARRYAGKARQSWCEIGSAEPARPTSVAQARGAAGD